MKIRQIHLSLLAFALTVSPAFGGSYSPNLVNGVTYTLAVSVSTSPTANTVHFEDVVQNFASVPEFSQLLIPNENHNANADCNASSFDTADFDTYYVDSGSPSGWDDANYVPTTSPTITVGHGVFFIPAGNITLHFNGSDLDNAHVLPQTQTILQGHWYLRGCQTPTPVSSWLGLMAAPEPNFPVAIRAWNGTGYTLLTQWDGAQWNPPFPPLAVGQAVWIGPTCSAVISGHVHVEQSISQTCISTTPLQNWTVRAVSGVNSYFGITDANGYYSILVPPIPGSYTVNSYQPPAGWVQEVCGGVPPYHVPGPGLVGPVVTGQLYGGRDIQVQNTFTTGSSEKDLALDLVSYFPYPLRTPCCGQDMTYVITYRNAGSVELGNGINAVQGPVNVTLTLPAGLTFASELPGSFPFSTPPAGGLTGTPLLTGANRIRHWTLSGSLAPLESGMIMFKVTLPSSPCSGSIAASARITFTGWNSGSALLWDIRPADNTRPLSQQRTCSHDPNDMLVTPAGCGPEGFIPAGQPLTYLIRFQNTGSAPAYQVVVSNLLSANLDVSTLKVIGSSHANVLEVQGNQLVWTFPKIVLPAQSTDDLGSQGYVKYQVSPLAAAPVGALITNNAAIFFDLNAAVNTVTTTNTITASPVPVAAFTVTPQAGSTGHINDFTYTGGSSGATYLWDFGADATPSTSTAQNPAGVVFASDGDKLVSLQVSLGDCPSDPAEQIVTVGVPILNAQIVGGQLLLSWRAMVIIFRSGVTCSPEQSGAQRPPR